MGLKMEDNTYTKKAVNIMEHCCRINGLIGTDSWRAQSSTGTNASQVVPVFRFTMAFHFISHESLPHLHELSVLINAYEFKFHFSSGCCVSLWSTQERENAGFGIS